MGIEEELLLVDPEDGTPVPIGESVIADAMARHGDQPGRGGIEHELMREQIEIESSPSDDLEDVTRQLRALRQELATAAERHGAAVIATATCPTRVLPTPVPDERYQRILGVLPHRPRSSHWAATCRLGPASPGEAVGVGPDPSCCPCCRADGELTVRQGHRVRSYRDGPGARPGSAPRGVRYLGLRPAVGTMSSRGCC